MSPHLPLSPRPSRGTQRTTLRVAVVLTGTLGLSASVAACSFALDFSGIDDGVRDGASNDVTTAPADGADVTASGEGEGGADGSPTPPDATTSDVTVPPTDGSSDASDASDAGDATHAPSDGGCPTTLPGPVLVPTTAGVCIDSTEVTNAQFMTYVNATGSSVPTSQPAVCSWNTTTLPFNWPPSGSADLPITNVNWCQAFLYCAWAGKHLCGAPAGGAADPMRWDNPAASAWYAACSHDGIKPYPYGTAYSGSTCNGSDFGAGKSTASVSSCVGGYPGVYDLSGNVLEWEDACMAADGGTTLAGASDYCGVRGGAYNTDASALRCDDGEQGSRMSQADFLGFRCCTP